MLRLALLSALLSCTIGNPLAVAKSKSSAGTTPRRLEEAAYSWMTGYTLKYENCFASAGMASFRLCPESDSCVSGCSGGGQYLVDFWFFIDAFTEAQMGAREYACEMVRENCGDDSSEDACYANAGMRYCIDNDDEFDIQEYLECREYEDGLYIGPYCSTDDAFSVYLGIFTDEYCTVQTDDSTFYDVEGYVLPYSATSKHSIIQNECASCREHDGEQDQADGDQSDEDEVLEQCEELYGDSSKCEEDLDLSYPDTSACSYIHQLYKEEDAIKSNSGGLTWGPWATVLFMSLLGIAGCVGGFWAYRRHSKHHEFETTGPSDEGLIS